MSDSESSEGDCLEPLLFSDQKLPSLSDFMALLGHYKRAVYEQYYVHVDQIVWSGSSPETHYLAAT